MSKQFFIKDGYAISDLDASGTTKYYGFLDETGNYYILAMTDTTARYYRGSANESYITDWNNRASLDYNYFHDVF
jgi:hypothetical protein